MSVYNGIIVLEKSWDNRTIEIRLWYTKIRLGRAGKAGCFKIKYEGWDRVND